ncbi:hypothetical protein [Streptomyces sp. NPDC010273]|uniref:hypothetical protein n=1 Tax=Streptomyces sp. NPDC010273 TaxID=3364829 RepID=UPI0036E5B178
MTDNTPVDVEPDTEAEGWNDSADGESFPEYPANPHNHRFTLSMNGQGPMIVVRANTGEEAKEAFEELEDAGTGAAIGRAWAAIRAGAALGNGLGATPVPVVQDAPGVPVPPPVAAGVPAPPPLPPAPAVQNRGTEYAGAGWYRLNVPFKSKAAFDGIVAQYQMRKGRPSEGGNLSFNKDDKSWYVSPEYAGAFNQFSPMPA